jgi:hypothetical protein
MRPTNSACHSEALNRWAARSLSDSAGSALADDFRFGSKTDAVPFVNFVRYGDAVERTKRRPRPKATGAPIRDLEVARRLEALSHLTPDVIVSVMKSETMTPFTAYENCLR